MYDLISVGDIKLDTFVLLDKATSSCNLQMPECKLCIDYGAKIDVDIVDSQIAGTAPNVAVGISRMNKKTAVISNMGPDTTLRMALEVLKKEGVSTKYIRSIKGAKSAYSVVLNFKGEKTILTSHNKKKYKIPKPIQPMKWMYVGEMGPGYETFYSTAANYVKKNKIKLGINPGSIQIEEKKPQLFELIKQADVLFVNLEEAQVIAGEHTTEIHHLITSLWKLGAKNVVITDGKNGAYGFDGKNLYHSKIFPGKLVEATGAGDSFATGFIGAKMNNKTMQNALAWGCVNSSSVIGYVGPQKGLLSNKEIIRRLKNKTNFKVKEI